MADRGVAPATGKLLEVAIVVLFVGLLSSTLYGGAIPTYRTTAADEVSDRTLAAASHRVQQTVPPNGTTVSARSTVDLPETIQGRPYALRADGERLVLEHPRPGVAGTSRLALPDHVVSVTGRWRSTVPAVVEVEGSSDGVHVRLARGEPP